MLRQSRWRGQKEVILLAERRKQWEPHYVSRGIPLTRRKGAELEVLITRGDHVNFAFFFACYFPVTKKS